MCFASVKPVYETASLPLYEITLCIESLGRHIFSFKKRCLLALRFLSVVDPVWTYVFEKTSDFNFCCCILYFFVWAFSFSSRRDWKLPLVMYIAKKLLDPVVGFNVCVCSFGVFGTFDVWALAVLPVLDLDGVATAVLGLLLNRSLSSILSVFLPGLWTGTSPEWPIYTFEVGLPIIFLAKRPCNFSCFS